MKRRRQFKEKQYRDQLWGKLRSIHSGYDQYEDEVDGFLYWPLHSILWLELGYMLRLWIKNSEET